MSLVTAGPLARRQLSPFLSHDSTNQQVPDSPLSAFFGTHIPSPSVARLCSPSSGSPLAQVPDCGSPLLRQLLDCKLHALLPKASDHSSTHGRSEAATRRGHDVSFSSVKTRQQRLSSSTQQHYSNQKDCPTLKKR